MDKLVEYSEGEECKKRLERCRTEESKRLILDTQKTIIKIQRNLKITKVMVYLFLWVMNLKVKLLLKVLSVMKITIFMSMMIKKRQLMGYTQ